MDDEAFERQLALLPRERTALLPALRLAGEHFGYVSDTNVGRIARHLRLTENEVEGVVTSYPELYRTVKTAPRVRVCTGTACTCAGAGNLLAELRRMAATGSFELEEVACSFLCGVGPVVEVDGRAHGRVSTSGLTALLKGWETD